MRRRKQQSAGVIFLFFTADRLFQQRITATATFTNSHNCSTDVNIPVPQPKLLATFLLLQKAETLSETKPVFYFPLSKKKKINNDSNSFELGKN